MPRTLQFGFNQFYLIWKGLLYLAIMLVAARPVQAQTKPGKLWDKTFGGSNEEYLNDALATSDGGYLLGGTSLSDKSGDKTENARGTAGNGGTTDIWLVKVNATGSKQWDKTIGSNPNESLTSMVSTTDGGYLLGGKAFTSANENSGDKTATGKGLDDYWLVKINANGTIQWDKTFGGVANDVLVSLVKTANSGYLLAGYSSSPSGGDKTDPSKGGTDFWLVKLDADGVKQWDKTYGGAYSDRLSAIVTTADGGYLLGGYLATEQTTTTGFSDYWLMKLDANGVKKWEKKVDENPNSMPSKLLVASDGGYLLGWTSGLTENGSQTEPSKGSYDFWLIKFGSDGTRQWDKIYGGSKNENLFTLTATSDKGYLLGGVSISDISGDKTEAANRSSFDYWLVKIDATGKKQWDKTFGGGYHDALTNIVSTQDGNYLLAGYSDSVLSGDKTEGNRGVGHDYWILKTKSTDCPAPALSASSFNTSNQPISVTATGCSGQLNWNTRGGTGTANGTIYTVSTPGQYTITATCTVNSCTSPAASLSVSIQPGVSPLKLVAPTYNCQTGAITFNTQGGNSSLLEYAAAGITRWSTSRNHTVEAGLRNDPKVILLQARQNGVIVSYDFNLPAACPPSSPTNTPPQPPSPPILMSPVVAQVGVQFSGTLAAFTDNETSSPLSYSLTGLSGGLSFNQTGRIISGTPTQAGSFVLTYQATDAQGVSNRINFTLTVNPNNPVPSNFDGYLDKVECGTIRGWVWDRNKPNTPITVEFYTGNIVWGSVAATIFRIDLKAAGKGNGNHAYSFEVPTALKDGTQRMIYARVPGAAYELKWSGKPLQCPAPTRLATEMSEPISSFKAVLLGNPVANGEVLVEISGVQGQSVTLSLINTEGRLMSQTQVKITQSVERQRLSLPHRLPGLLLLRVSTATLSKTLKIVSEK